jgi:hypothetical protein
MGISYKKNGLTVTEKAQLRGTTLLEACLAFSLMMVSVVGCLAAFQMAIKLRKSVEIKSRALIQAEGLADTVKRITSGEALSRLLTAEKIRLEEELPGSVLSWRTTQSVKQVYQIGFLWRLPGAHRIEFIATPGDFR